jgi:hypothetical protein
MTVGGEKKVDDSGHEERGKYGDDEFLLPIDPAFCDDVKESSHIPFWDVI